MIEVSAKTMVSREKWVKFATCAGVAPSGHAGRPIAEMTRVQTHQLIYMPINRYWALYYTEMKQTRLY